MAEGCVVFVKEKLRFGINSKLEVEQYKAEERMCSHELVEELMLIANQLAAEHMNTHNPSLSLLRHHP